jgi:hypothetical protein
MTLQKAEMLEALDASVYGCCGFFSLVFPLALQALPIGVGFIKAMFAGCIGIKSWP